MRTTIDGGGRIVIPKAVRDAAGLEPGAEVEVRLRDGRVEIEPTGPPTRIVKRRGRVWIETDAQVAPLTTADVREVLERVRR